MIMNMRKLTLVLCFISLFASTAAAQAANAPESAHWKRYTVKGEEFSVTLPTLPAMTSNKAFSEVIGQWRLERVLVTSADGVAYSIYACDNSKRRQSLKDFIADQAAKFGLDLTSERQLNVSGFTGKEFTARDKAKIFNEQFFATEGHLYRFVASGANADHAGIKQFFSSITLGENQEGIEVAEGPGVPLQAEGAEKLFTAREVDQKLRLTKKPDPSYTDEAKAKSVRGVVALRCVFSSTGKVTDIVVISGLPYGLTEKAIEAARKIKFVPAMKDGKPVSMWMLVEYNFNLY